MNSIDQAIKEFEQSQDWTIYKDYEKREMAFRAGVKYAKGENTKERYFLVGYNFQNDFKQGSGNFRFESESFPSNVTIKKRVKEKIEWAKDENIVVTNIFEFKSREDYEDFIADEEEEE